MVVGYFVFAFLLLLTVSIFTDESSRLCDVGLFSENGMEGISNSEEKIKDYLEENNIHYEYRLDLREGFAHPSFYLPEYDVYVEFCGLLEGDDSVNKEYLKRINDKISMHHQNGIKYISIYPNNLENLDVVFRKKLEEKIGYSLPQKHA